MSAILNVSLPPPGRGESVRKYLPLVVVAWTLTLSSLLIRKYRYTHGMMVGLYVFIAASIFPFFENYHEKNSTTKNTTTAAATVTSITSSTAIESAFVAAALLTAFSQAVAMTTIVIIDATIIADVCCSAVSDGAGGNFGFRVGVFRRLCSWSPVILGTVSISLAWKKVITCWCDGHHDLFFNSGGVNKDGYNGRCGNNDGNGGGRQPIFV